MNIGVSRGGTSVMSELRRLNTPRWSPRPRWLGQGLTRATQLRLHKVSATQLPAFKDLT